MNESAYSPLYQGMHRIWQDLRCGDWFYVEQALESKNITLYTKNLSCLSNRKYFFSEIYAFENPLEYVGNIDKVEKIERKQFLLKEGCTVNLSKKGIKFYKGKTHDKA